MAATGSGKAKGVDSAYTDDTVRLEQDERADPTELRETLGRDSDTPLGLPAGQGEPALGEVLKGRYRLDERIGRGGMSIVYRATDLEAVRLGHGNGNVAIKVLGSHLASHEAALFDEVQKTRGLQQENIVDVYGFEPDKPSSFMVMELLSGTSLDRFVRASYPTGVPLRIAFPFIKAMGTALSYAHRRGVIHSDFKPSNVLVGGPGTVKVLDFGIARAARSEAPAPGDRPAGVTPAYASCEMLEELPADQRDDVFCFGLVVYFMLTGTHPFNGLAATEARDVGLTVSPVRCLSRAQNAALARALRFKRAERNVSIEELVASLAQTGKHRLGRAAAVAAALLLVAVTALGPYMTQPREDAEDVFVRSLCPAGAVTGQQPESAEDARTVRVLIAQGNQYLQRGQHPFDPGLLSENVSSANGAFQSALYLGPHECDTAAHGIARVANVYATEARRLYKAGEYRKAASTAGTGLRIWKDHHGMRRVLEEASRKLGIDAPAEP